MAGLAPHEATHRALGEPVDIFLERDLFEHLLHVEAIRQRELAQDAVHAGVGGERSDGVVHLRL